MLILPRSCFLHVPKTGGSWVKKAIRASGIRCNDYVVNGDPHIGVEHCPCPEKFKFAFVRSPVDLYRSYWQYKMTVGWDKKNPIDMSCRSNSFHDFVRNVLHKYPGIYGKSLLQFVGEGKTRIDFIGKYEHLVDDLIAALRQAGEIFDETRIRTLQPVNVSDKTRFPADYTAELEEEVRKQEATAMRMFGYE
jgi:hypothetical protein